VRGIDEAALVALLEAIYSIEREDGDWLRDVLMATIALSGNEHHYLGYFYDASDVEAFDVWNVCSIDLPPEVDEAFRATRLKVGPALLKATLRRVHVGSMRRTGMPHVAPLLEQRARVGWGDMLTVNGLDPSGFGCLVTIGTREPEFSPPPPEMAVYARIANHLATAFRCRRRLGMSKSPRATASEPEQPAAEAILDAGGRFVHAEGAAAEKAAREQISEAAKAIEAVRASGRKAGMPALDAWQPMVAARWTLVDSFEENGRRYVVARENQARAENLDALTQRERQVVLQAAVGFTTKEIAYALGLSDSTVRVLMARAMKRLGVRSRAELLSHPSLRKVRADRTDH
jgi:DNA-binding CsgD family transcriptional regulator